MQLPSSPSNKKISELYGMVQRNELILQPEFQRKLVWTLEHKEAFIETILLGFPFPEIYLAQKGIDFNTIQTQQVVVDGQQRLSAIISYISDSFQCKKIKQFKDLSGGEKSAFLNYNVVVRDLQDIEPDKIKEVFRRINLTKYNLEPIEINNALYDGAFITTAKEILETIDTESFDIFSERELSRMGNLNYILLLMSTIEEGGYFSGNSKTEEYIQGLNEEYPLSEEKKEHIIKIFEVIKNIGLSKLSIWYRKSNFFTLFIELYNAGDIKVDLLARLEAFERNIIASKGIQENDFGNYYAAMYSGTNSRTARINRGDLFKKYVLQDENAIEV